MCNSPHRVLIPGKPVPAYMDVQCGKCWACVKNYENDLIGRGLCEIPYCQEAWFVTLTYDNRMIKSPDQPKHVHKRDLQNFFKRLRRGGHNPRYIASAETGKKGTRRVHFHLILFWRGMPPTISKYWNGKDALKAWPWGHADIQRHVTSRNLRYVIKYATKTRTEKRRHEDHIPEPIKYWATWSKKPVLGCEMILKLGSDYAEKRLLPRSLRYQPPDGNPKNHYSLSGRAEEIFLDAFFAGYPEAANLTGTDWYNNAVRRWKNIKAERAWKRLTDKQRERIISESFRSTRFANVDNELTSGEKMRLGWANYDAKERARTWLDDLHAARLEEVGDMSAQLLSRFGFSPDLPPDPLTARALLRALLSHE